MLSLFTTQHVVNPDYPSSQNGIHCTLHSARLVYPDPLDPRAVTRPHEWIKFCDSKYAGCGVELCSLVAECYGDIKLELMSGRRYW